MKIENFKKLDYLRQDRESLQYMASYFSGESQRYSMSIPSSTINNRIAHKIKAVILEELLKIEKEIEEL